MLNAAALITISVGLSVLLCLVVSLAVVGLIRIRRAQIRRKDRDRRIYQAIWGGSGLDLTGSRLNVTDEYPVMHQQYDVENGNLQSQNKGRWGSLPNNIPPPREAPPRNIRKAIISGCLSPLSAIIQRTRTWYQASITPHFVAELPSDISPRNTFENHDNGIRTNTRGRDSSATYAQSQNTKSSNKSAVTNTPKLDLGGRESPLPGPPPSRPLPPVPSTQGSSHSDPPGRRSTSHGSALSSKTASTSILDTGPNMPPQCNIDPLAVRSSSTMQSLSVQGRHSEITRARSHQREKSGRYDSWMPSNFRHSGWEQYTSRKGMEVVT